MSLFFLFFFFSLFFSSQGKQTRHTFHACLFQARELVCLCVSDAYHLFTRQESNFLLQHNNLEKKIEISL